ncbi:MAG: hypothetical protein HWN65_08405 [Candidatus Helarchaeota archaeon]|nr:hypothetical protein [Candidatus Helarchaeota archaeon]
MRSRKRLHSILLIFYLVIFLVVPFLNGNLHFGEELEYSEIQSNLSGESIISNLSGQSDWWNYTVNATVDSGNLSQIQNITVDIYEETSWTDEFLGIQPEPTSEDYFGLHYEALENVMDNFTDYTLTQQTLQDSLVNGSIEDIETSWSVVGYDSILTVNNSLVVLKLTFDTSSTNFTDFAYCYVNGTEIASVNLAESEIDGLNLSHYASNIDFWNYTDYADVIIGSDFTHSTDQLKLKINKTEQDYEGTILGVAFYFQMQRGLKAVQCWYEVNNISAPSQNYTAEFSFENDADYSEPSGWYIKDGDEGSPYGGTVQVIATKQNHDKVVEFVASNPEMQEMEDIFSSQTTGTIEMWIMQNGSCSSQTSIFGTINDQNGFEMKDNVLKTFLTSQTLISSMNDDQWYHIRMDFDKPNDNITFYVDQTYVLHESLQLSANPNKFTFYTVSGDVAFFVDAIDYSWSSGYYTNRNYVPVGVYKTTNWNSLELNYTTSININRFRFDWNGTRHNLTNDEELTDYQFQELNTSTQNYGLHQFWNNGTTDNWNLLTNFVPFKLQINETSTVMDNFLIEENVTFGYSYYQNFVLNQSLTIVTDDGIYNGTYSFTDDDVGSTPDGWSCSGEIQVIATLDGHSKVVELIGVVGSDYGTNDFPDTATGTVEFWVRSNDTTKLTLYIIEDQSSSHSIFFGLSSGYLMYCSNDHPAGAIIASASNNTWYHVRIQFDCASGWYIWVDGVKYGEYDFYGTPTLIDGFRFIDFDVTGGQASYLDAVDYSWDSGYVENRSMTALTAWNDTYYDIKNVVRSQYNMSANLIDSIQADYSIYPIFYDCSFGNVFDFSGYNTSNDVSITFYFITTDGTNHYREEYIYEISGVTIISEDLDDITQYTPETIYNVKITAGLKTDWFILDNPFNNQIWYRYRWNGTDFYQFNPSISTIDNSTSSVPVLTNTDGLWNFTIRPFGMLNGTWNSKVRICNSTTYTEWNQQFTINKESNVYGGFVNDPTEIIFYDESWNLSKERYDVTVAIDNSSTDLKYFALNSTILWGYPVTDYRYPTYYYLNNKSSPQYIYSDDPHFINGRYYNPNWRNYGQEQSFEVKIPFNRYYAQSNLGMLSSGSDGSAMYSDVGRDDQTTIMNYVVFGDFSMDDSWIDNYWYENEGMGDSGDIAEISEILSETYLDNQISLKDYYNTYTDFERVARLIVNCSSFLNSSGDVVVDTLDIKLRSGFFWKSYDDYGGTEIDTILKYPRIALYDFTLGGGELGDSTNFYHPVHTLVPNFDQNIIQNLSYVRGGVSPLNTITLNKTEIEPYIRNDGIMCVGIYFGFANFTSDSTTYYDSSMNLTYFEVEGWSYELIENTSVFDVDIYFQTDINPFQTVKYIVDSSNVTVTQGQFITVPVRIAEVFYVDVSENPNTSSDIQRTLVYAHSKEPHRLLINTTDMSFSFSYIVNSKMFVTIYVCVQDSYSPSNWNNFSFIIDFEEQSGGGGGSDPSPIQWVRNFINAFPTWGIPLGIIIGVIVIAYYFQKWWYEEE